jgi:hypothetical protein
MHRIESGDIDSSELFVGSSDLNSPLAQRFQSKGVQVAGVRASAKSVVTTLEKLYSEKA